MKPFRSPSIPLVILLALGVLLCLTPARFTMAQDEMDEEALAEETDDVGIIPALKPPGAGPELDEEETPEEEEPERVEGGAAGEGQRRWKIKIDGAVRANYVFNDSPESFVVKYRWEISGDANAATAVIRGDAEINADVEGVLSKWPTGECRLEITIPKIPFELTFRRNDEEKGNIALNFKQTINENWSSKCSFEDAPGAQFNTTGPPEKWLTRALEKARPPLRSIITDLGDEETTTSFVIGKEIIDDAPLGTIEFEGTGVVTITPAGAE